MPRRKYIPPSEWASQRIPHAPSYPPGLWWYRSLAAEESARVLRAYLQRRGARGAKTVPSYFPKKLEIWLSELTTNQGSERRVKYWTVKGYALAHKINLHPFMAWFRTLEEVAKKLYPERVPPGRREQPPLSDKEIQSIRAEYLETGKVREIAKNHGIDSWRIGRICREEKKARSGDPL